MTSTSFVQFAVETAKGFLPIPAPYAFTYDEAAEIGDALSELYDMVTAVDRDNLHVIVWS